MVIPVFILAKAHTLGPVNLFDVREITEEESRALVDHSIMVKRKALRLKIHEPSPAFINSDLGQIN